MLLREQRVPPRRAAFLRPGAPAWLFMQKLGFLPPHRWCLQKGSQFPVVLDGAVAPLWIPALPAYAELLFSLISLKVLLLLLTTTITVRLTSCMGSQYTWFVDEFLAFLRVFMYKFSPCEVLQGLLKPKTLPVR